MSLRIWQADCGLLDAVLLLTFDARELEDLARARGIEITCGCPDARGLVQVIHRACHAPTPLALQLERLLDVVHRGALEARDAFGIDAFGAELVGRDLWQVDHLPGRLWAVVTCDDPAAERLRTYLRHALALDGLRALATRVHGDAA
jgi:hypothetical protein